MNACDFVTTWSPLAVLSAGIGIIGLVLVFAGWCLAVCFSGRDK